MYLVDLSPSLCEVARNRFIAHEWTNVHVLVADACDFTIDYKSADLITFSYSLSMIPTFNAAIDNAVSKLDKQGLLLQLILVFKVMTPLLVESIL